VKAGILSGHPGVSKELLVTASDASKYSFLFSAPEALIGVEKWRQILLNTSLQQQIVAFTVDEAHCVSKWSVSLVSLTHVIMVNIPIYP